MHSSRFPFLVSFCLASVCFAAEPPAKTITPGDNLVMDGIPPIPADVIEQVGRYTESRAADVQDWHPGKAEMLITTRFGDTNQVHRVAAPGASRPPTRRAGPHMHYLSLDRPSRRRALGNRRSSGAPRARQLARP